MIMKYFILFISLFMASQLIAQESKSEQILKDIHLLELENNRIIMGEYMKVLNDSTSVIPIDNLNKDMVASFRNSRPELQDLQKQLEKNQKELDAIKQKDAEYRKYREDYVGSTGDEREKQRGIYRKIVDRLSKSDSRFKELYDSNKRISQRLNYLTLTGMIADYHARGEVFPESLIPFKDLRTFNELSKVRENRNKLAGLTKLYGSVLEKELRQKYNLSDSD